MEGQDATSKQGEVVQENIAYEYLCHLQEVKIWMESILKEMLPPITELEENLRNGVYLAKIGNFIAPEEVPLSRIYDIFQHRYKAFGLQFKHTDNINYFIKALNVVNFPKIFHPETMDIYDKKNMPKVIYCIHALSTHLFKLGKAPSIQDLYGKIEFNRDEIDTTCNELKKCGSEMPSFEKISGILINESDCDQTALHSIMMKTNDAIANNCCEDLLSCLLDSSAELVHVIPENIAEYMESFRTAKEDKFLNKQNRFKRNSNESELYDELLNQSEIQGYIRSTNCDCLWIQIQNSVESEDKEKLQELFTKLSLLGLKDFKMENIEYYMEVLSILDLEKTNLFNKNYSSREVMENIIRNGNRLCKERKRVLDAVTDIKKAVRNKNPFDLIKALRVSASKLEAKVLEENVTIYMKELESFLKISGDLNHNKIKSIIEAVNETNCDNSDDMKRKNSAVDPSVALEPFTLSPENHLLGECNKKTFLPDDLDKCITLLQAHIRGFIVRKKVRQKLSSHKFRTRTGKRKRKRERVFDENYFIQLTESFSRHVDKIVTIQAAWRGYQVRKSMKIPPPNGDCQKFMLLRQMALMRKIRGHDYSDQLKLQNLKSAVVETIKKNQELALKLDETDTRIGLLVQNKMLIQNSDTDRKRSQNGITNKFQSKGIKTFNKESKTVLDGYRQLFYMLQTDPSYLTRLITRMPQNSSHMIQTCVLSLFNYGSNSRDAYLLLRLFRSALVEEVKCKFQKPMDAIKGNPVVLRLALSFSRQYEGYNPLREILGFLIESVLNENTYIDTNPVDIYRRWVNKMETETGQTSNLPAVVTQSEALSYPEVSEQLKHNLKVLKVIFFSLFRHAQFLNHANQINETFVVLVVAKLRTDIALVLFRGILVYMVVILPDLLSMPQAQANNAYSNKVVVWKKWVKTFLKRITACSDKFPYALRFIAKVLWVALVEKFPEEPEKDIMKIIGNLVFYQYINSAIVAPDAFYMISLPPDRHLKPEQRRNLASIAKILQFASWKKGFGIESQHLMCMNSFIISCHEEMKRFCKKCCTVEDLEQHFNITKYSEAALIEKPKVYISIEDICECHKILYEERKHISSDPFDPIQEVLDMLGEPPSVADLVGFSPTETMSSRAGKTQLCLELDNKFQLPSEDPTEAEKLFIRTKELIVNRINTLKGRTLKESVEIEENSDIASNLMQLELSGLVKSSDDYNAIIEAIITDITEEQLYKQTLVKEIKSLTTAYERLNEKRKYFEDQLSCYEQYLNTCLNSLTKPTKKSGEKIRTAKYSANHLLEKGVLVSLEGVPSSQLKNVQFEITGTEINGVYSIKGRFMGVEVEKINLDVQDLLQHQFEGQPEMDLFGKAKINVNLLLHLLNKKFHNHS